MTVFMYIIKFDCHGKTHFKYDQKLTENLSNLIKQWKTIKAKILSPKLTINHTFSYSFTPIYKAFTGLVQSDLVSILQVKGLFRIEF